MSGDNLENAATIPHGFTRLSRWGLLGISGHDAKSFLQGQITCHVDEITPTHSKIAGHCDLKGRLQSLFDITLVVTSAGPLYLLMMPREMITLALNQFKKYALFSNVNFIDLTNHMPLIGLYSPHSLVSSSSEERTENVMAKNLAKGQYWVRRLKGAPSRYIIICENLPVYETIESQLLFSYSPAPDTLWEQLDIEAGLPTIYPSTIGMILPQHINLISLGGISFTKGCYLGQEIVARMYYRGTVKKDLYTSKIPSPSLPIQPGDSLLEGIVIRSVSLPLSYLVMAVLEKNIADDDPSWFSYNYY